MTPFVQHTGKAALLMIDNVDTDQIIPSREMKTVSRNGLADGLFAGWRYTEPGGRELNPDFVLNQPEQAGTSILISGQNFGCGSSREHAAWALAEYGIRAVVARSFGEIFYSNCVRNGILPIPLPDADIDMLERLESPFELEIDLHAQTVRSSSLPDWQARFEIGKYPKRLLIEGLDPIQLTLSDKDRILAFIESDKRERPWIY